MTSISRRNFLIYFATTLWAGNATATPQVGLGDKVDLAVVAKTVQAYFESRPGYAPGDLITRSQIERALTTLDDAGTPVPNASAILRRGVDDNSFLARELSKGAGRSFMRRLATNPANFAHLDRLSTIPRGEQTIRDLIRTKDGDKMIEYLATTKGGKKTGSMLAGVSNGANLNKPTEKIYTVDDLIAALKSAYTSGK